MSMRIALISEYTSPLDIMDSCDCGGQNVYVGQLALRLGEMGHTVDIFTRRDDMTLPEIVVWGHGIRIIHVPAGPARPVRKEDLLPYMDEFGRYVQFWIRQGRGSYDVVHANCFMSGLVARQLREKWSIPFVVTFHALGAVRSLYQGACDGFPKERNLIESEIVADADAILAKCPQDANDLSVLYGASPRKLRLVPDGFDPKQLFPMDKIAARRILDIAESEFMMLHVGRIVPRKGVATVIEALARLRDQYNVVARLLSVGGESENDDISQTPEMGRLKALADVHGVSDKVTFVGRRRLNQLRLYYSAADLFITTPWHEPFDITPVEAMACGTPVLGAAVGGIKYTVQHMVTGYLVPPRNTAAVAFYMNHAIRNTEERRFLGEQALVRARTMFTWTRVAALVESVYRDVIDHVVGDRIAVPAVCVGNATDTPMSFLS